MYPICVSIEGTNIVGKLTSIPEIDTFITKSALKLSKRRLDIYNMLIFESPTTINLVEEIINNRNHIVKSINDIRSEISVCKYNQSNNRYIIDIRSARFNEGKRSRFIIGDLAEEAEIIKTELCEILGDHHNFTSDGLLICKELYSYKSVEIAYSKSKTWAE